MIRVRGKLDIILRPLSLLFLFTTIPIVAAVTLLLLTNNTVQKKKRLAHQGLPLMASPCGRQTLLLEPFQPRNLTPSGPQYLSSLAPHKVGRFAHANKATRNFGRDQRVRARGEAGGTYGTRFEGGVDVGVRQHVVDVRLVVSARPKRKHFRELLGREVTRLFEGIGFCVRVSGEFA
jgi:hypothetical protein